MKTAFELLPRNRFHLYRKIGLLPFHVLSSTYIDLDDLTRDIKHNYAYYKANRLASWNSSNRFNKIFEETVKQPLHEIEEEALHTYLKGGLTWQTDSNENTTAHGTSSTRPTPVPNLKPGAHI